MRIHFFIVTGLLFFCAHSNSQSLQLVNKLKIGDTVPNVVFKQMLKYKKQSTTLYELKGKPVILDLWHTACGACIAQFPKIEQLQRNLSGEALILPVGFDFDRKDIRKFLEKNEGTSKGLDIPSIVCSQSDTILRQLFPDDFPGIVWIDQNSVFRGSTGYRELNEANVRNFITGKWYPVRSKSKRYITGRVDFLIPWTKTVNYGTRLAPYTDTVGIMANLLTLTNQRNPDFIRFFYVNEPIENIYKEVYELTDDFRIINSNVKHILFESKHDDFYKTSSSTKHLRKNEIDHEVYKQKNYLNFEMILPRTYSLKQAYRMLINDLDRLLIVKSGIEKRKVKCYALIEIKPLPRSKSIVASENKPDVIDANGWKVSQLIELLNYNTPTSPIILNETGGDGTLSFTLKVYSKDIESYRNELQIHGFDLIPVEREIELLVIKDLRN